MKEFSNTDIKEINNLGIIFKNNFMIKFDECVEGWAKSHNISSNETNCVASRDITTSPPHFIFYTKYKIRLNFNKYKILKFKNEKDFTNMRFLLRKYGYSTYDLS